MSKKQDEFWFNFEKEELENDNPAFLQLEWGRKTQEEKVR